MNKMIGAMPVKVATQKGYGKQISAQFRYSTALHPQLVTVGAKIVVKDLLDRNDLSPRTLAGYRAALLWHIRTLISPSDTDLEALALLDRYDPPASSRRSKRRHVISEDDLELLLAEIESGASKSVWALPTARWIRATLVSGLRPVEWVRVIWDPTRRNSLRIENAKSKLFAPAFQRKDVNKKLIQELAEKDIGRAELSKSEKEARLALAVRTFRTVPLENIQAKGYVQAQMDSIREALSGCVSDDARIAEFSKYHDQCRKVIYRACKSIWKGRKFFSLYTLRGQYSANMKVCVGPTETAKRMGHSGRDSPSAAHYGIGRQAHGHFKELGQKSAWRQFEPPFSFTKYGANISRER